MYHGWIIGGLTAGQKQTVGRQHKAAEIAFDCWEFSAADVG